jgi:hypothetical protein
MIGPKGSQRKQNAAGLKPHLVTLDNQHLQRISWGFNETDGDSCDTCDTLKICVVTKVDMAKVCQSMPNFKLSILVWFPAVPSQTSAKRDQSNSSCCSPWVWKIFPSTCGQFEGHDTSGEPLLGGVEFVARKTFLFATHQMFGVSNAEPQPCPKSKYV